MPGQLPWQARARAAAQRLGIEPRNFRRVRWLHKTGVLRAYDASVWRNLGFLLLDPEPHNFTYALANHDELAAWVASVSGAELQAAVASVDEPAFDATLQRRLRAATKGRWLWTKSRPPFGKRLGWYALARVLRPELIVETGVHDGLGAMLLLRALERNRDEGHPGRLISFDVNRAAGWLVGEHPLWEFRAEASQAGLPEVMAANSAVDMFVYDGWHSYEHERSELELVLAHLAPDGVLLSDDSAVTGALADVCLAHGFSYWTVHVRPRDHFHPGAALGAGRPAGRP